MEKKKKNVKFFKYNKCENTPIIFIKAKLRIILYI